MISKIKTHLKKVNVPRTVEIINQATTYVLVAFLWAPHGARECATAACNGPQFISPMIVTFLMPNWLMDLSLHGWLIQLMFAPPLLLITYLMFRFSKHKYFPFLQVYAVRWGIMWLAILLYYNLVFWPLEYREFLNNLFAFTRMPL